MKLYKFVGSLALGFLTVHSAFAVLNVNLDPGNFVSPEAVISVQDDVILVPGNTVTNYIANLTPNTSYFGRMGGLTFFRSTDSPDVNSVIDSTAAGFYQNQESGPNSYQSGAQQGTDNWVYITNLSDEVAWAQVDIQENIITPIKYVWDLSDRTAAIQLSDAVDAVPVPEPSAFALLFGMFGLAWVTLRRR